MLIAYNAKNKYRLPIKKLYGNQRDEELDDEEGEDDADSMWNWRYIRLFRIYLSLVIQKEIENPPVRTFEKQTEWSSGSITLLFIYSLLLIAELDTISNQDRHLLFAVWADAASMDSYGFHMVIIYKINHACT